MIPIANSYFAGIGMFDLGLQRGGIDVRESYELDADCVAVGNQNHPGRFWQCDVTKKLVANENRCDIRVFTYPCTKYSTIGDIHGVREGDDLYLHALRHMVIDPPEAFVAENVPGMRKFKVVMEVMTRLPTYYVSVFCPVKASLWLPQRRDRLIILGTRRPFAWRPPESTRRVTLAEILEENPQVEIPDYVNTRIDGGYRDLPIVSDPAKGDIAPTCVAHYAKDLGTRLVVDKRYPRGLRPYSIREYARLQGLPDTFTLPTDRKAYRMIGNGVPIPVGEWVGRELCRYFNQQKSGAAQSPGERRETPGCSAASTEETLSLAL